jgi:hypothetical protein
MIERTAKNFALHPSRLLGDSAYGSADMLGWLVDEHGIEYLVLGGGGAEQDPILPGRTSIKVPSNYPPDLYWRGKPPHEEYNYVLVDVAPGEKTKFTLTRYRPGSAKPFASEALFS